MLFRREIDPRRFGGDMVRTILDVRELVTALPRRIDKISKNIEHGNFKVHIELENYVETIRGLVDKVSHSFNRLSLAIIIAALIIAASSLLPLFKGGSETGRNILIGIMGLLSVIWVIWMFKSRKS